MTASNDGSIVARGLACSPRRLGIPRDRLRRAPGRVALVTGPAGCGKTALLLTWPAACARVRARCGWATATQSPSRSAPAASSVSARPPVSTTSTDPDGRRPGQSRARPARPPAATQRRGGGARARRSRARRARQGRRPARRRPPAAGRRLAAIGEPPFLVVDDVHEDSLRRARARPRATARAHNVRHDDRRRLPRPGAGHPRRRRPLSRSRRPPVAGSPVADAQAPTARSPTAPPHRSRKEADRALV